MIIGQRKGTCYREWSVNHYKQIKLENRNERLAKLIKLGHEYLPNCCEAKMWR